MLSERAAMQSTRRGTESRPTTATESASPSPRSGDSPRGSLALGGGSELCVSSGYAATTGSLLQWNSVPSAQTRCRTVARLRASATFALLRPRRFATSIAHRLSVLNLVTRGRSPAPRALRRLQWHARLRVRAAIRPAFQCRPGLCQNGMIPPMSGRSRKRAKHRRRGKVTPRVTPKTEVLRIAVPQCSKFRGSTSRTARQTGAPTPTKARPGLLKPMLVGETTASTSCVGPRGYAAMKRW
jgi:hypothetical protein